GMDQGRRGRSGHLDESWMSTRRTVEPNGRVPLGNTGASLHVGCTPHEQQRWGWGGGRNSDSRGELELAGFADGRYAGACYRQECCSRRGHALQDGRYLSSVWRFGCLLRRNALELLQHVYVLDVDRLRSNAGGTGTVTVQVEGERRTENCRLERLGIHEV